MEMERVIVGVEGSVERFGEGGKKRICWSDLGGCWCASGRGRMGGGWIAEEMEDGRRERT